MILEQVLSQKNFPSPLILEGAAHPEWIEKIARRALCENLEACGLCRSCRLSKNQNHPDWIQASGELKIEELRDYLNELRRKAFQSSYRILSIKNFGQASHFVQNALLKTLEEPQENWLLILGTESSLTLLPTIRSRCLLFRLESPKEQGWEQKTLSLFQDIQRASDFTHFQELEKLFKSREETKEVWGSLLRCASSHSYPEFWQYFAPHLEEAHRQLDRNLHPKVLWENAWSKAIHEAH